MKKFYNIFILSVIMVAMAPKKVSHTRPKRPPLSQIV